MEEKKEEMEGRKEERREVRQVKFEESNMEIKEDRFFSPKRLKCSKISKDLQRSIVIRLEIILEDHC